MSVWRVAGYAPVTPDLGSSGKSQHGAQRCQRGTCRCHPFALDPQQEQRPHIGSVSNENRRRSQYDGEQSGARGNAAAKRSAIQSPLRENPGNHPKGDECGPKADDPQLARDADH